MRKLRAAFLGLGLLTCLPGCATTLLCEDIGQKAKTGHPEFLLEMPIVPLAVATDVALAPVEVPAMIVFAPLGGAIANLGRH